MGERNRRAWLVRAAGILMAACAGAATISPVAAQTLNLGSAAVLPEGRRYALREAQRELDDAISSMEKDVKEGGSALTRQRLRYRKFCLAMFQRGGELDAEGASCIIAAFQVAQGAADFDRAALSVYSPASGSPGRDAVRRFEDLTAALPIEKGAIPGDAAGLDMLLAARLAPLAELVEAAASPGGRPETCGWIVPGAEDAPALLARLRALDGATLVDAPPELKDDLSRFIERFAPVASADGGAEPNANSACAAAAAIVSGLEAAGTLPLWAPPPHRQALCARLAHAVHVLGVERPLVGEGRGESLTPDQQQLEAIADASRAAEQARLLLRLDVAPVKNVRLVRSCRELALDAILPADTRPETQGAPDVVMKALRAALDEGDRAGEPEPRQSSQLVREANAIWRLRRPDLRRTHEALFAATVITAKAGLGTTDPAFVAAVSALRTTADDLTGLRRTSRWLEGADDGALPPPLPPPPEPGADAPPARPPFTANDPVRKRTAARLLSLVKPIGVRDSRDAGLAAVRSLGEGLAALAPSAGEAACRAAMSGRGGDGEREYWRRGCGERETELLGALDRLRADLPGAWVAAWEVAPERGPGQRRGSAPMPVPSGEEFESRVRLLRAFADLFSLMEDVRTASGPTSPAPGSALAPRTGGAGPCPTLEAWPGWTATARSLAALAPEESATFAPCIEALIAGDSERAARAVSRADEAFAGVRLAAELDRRAASMGLHSSSALGQLSRPPLRLEGQPTSLAIGSAWMSDERATIAVVAWAALETDAAMQAAAAETDRDRRKEMETYAGALRAAANAEADGVLKRLPRE